MNRRLFAWGVLVTVMIAIAYAGRADGGNPPDDVLYRYSTFVNGLVFFGIVLGLVLAIAQPRFELLALRRPERIGRGVVIAVAVFVATGLTAYVVDMFSDPGEEQGLVPEEWDPDRALPFVLNFAVVALVAPLVEELTFRGLGYSLLERFGSVAAIVVIGITFGLVHGLVWGFPILAVFGAGLALLRERTNSVWPPIVLHGLFNALSLSVAVTT